MAGGFLVVGGAALALLALARRKSATTTTETPRLPSVDSALLTTNAATQGTIATRRLQERLTTDAVAKAVGTAALTVVGAVMSIPGVMNAVLNGLSTAIQAVFAGSFTAFLAVFAIVLIACIVATSIMQGIKDALTRFRAAMAAFGGSFNSLNQWELGTAKAWLQQLGVGFTVTNAEDFDFTVTRQVEKQYYTTRYKRYGLLVTAMPADQWRMFQIIVRLGAIDYFQRVGRIMNRAYMTWSSRDTGPDLFSIPDIRIPWMATKIDYVWGSFPLLADSAPRETDNVAAKITASQTIDTYQAAMAMALQSPTFRQMQLNNHFQAIMAGVALTRYDEWEPNPPNHPLGYAWLLYNRLGLTESGDHVMVDTKSGTFVFDSNYWGRTIVVDIAGVKVGRDGSVVEYAPGGGAIQANFNPK